MDYTRPWNQKLGNEKSKISKFKFKILENDRYLIYDRLNFCYLQDSFDLNAIEIGETDTSGIA